MIFPLSATLCPVSLRVVAPAAALLAAILCHPAIASAAPLAPNQINGLELWLDASSGVVTGAGNEVIGWNDLSANGHMATDPGAGNRPTLSTIIPGGRTAVAFGGATDFIRTEVSGTVGNGTPVEMMAVVFSHPTGISAASSGEMLAGLRGDGVNSDNPGCDPFCGLALGSLTSGLTDEIIHVSEGNRRRGWTDPTASIDTGIQIFFMEHTPSGYQFRLNQQDLPMTGSAFISDIVSVTLGKRDADNVGNFQGSIAEVIIFNQPVSDLEQAQLESFLLEKYGIIPEPSSKLLMLAGLLLLRRRRFASRVAGRSLRRRVATQ